MRKLAGFVAFLGFILIIGTAMMAFDTFMTDERRTEFRDGVNAALDDGSASYEEAREDGCRRRCGFFASMADMVVGLRDGVFLSMPFEPDAVFPPAPAGWTRSDYNLATVQGIVDFEMRRTAVFVSTQNTLLKQFADVAAANNVGAVRIYQQGEKAIAMSIMIDRNGIRSAKEGGANASPDISDLFARIDGLPVERRPQEAFVGFNNDPVPVDYRHLRIRIDGQVGIHFLALAEEEDIAAILAGFDTAPIVVDLPQVPAYYAPRTGLTDYVTAAIAIEE